MVYLTLAVGCLGAASLLIVIPIALHNLSKELPDE
jgi:hypothetical protein